eukprot:scaffold10924_cov68-Skeletonema_dohrnii-CCMP3373.AAC.1
MSGWDDEDDLDMLFDDDYVEDAAPLNNGDTTTNDDSNNNGWEDDDGLDALDDFSSQEEEKIELEPPAVTAATPLTQSSTAGTETTVVKMLNEHEKMMHNEIKQIQTADEDVAATNIEEQVAADNDEEDEDAWDFEDDEDIFNEDNDDLNFIDETTMASAPTENIAASLPTTTTIDAAQFSSSIMSDGTNSNNSNYQSNPPPPPPPPENNKVSVPETNKNPFLQDSDDEGPPPFEEQHDTAVLNNSNEEMDNAIVNDNDEDGWSDDDDLFEEGDELLDSSSPVQKTTAVAGVVATTAVPPPPPPPVPIAAPTATSAASNISPVANRTRSKNATPGPPPPLPKPQQQHYQHHHHHHQQQQPPLNPSQQRIHQMLSNYTTNLKSNNYPSRLHSKLHMYQTKPRTSKENNTITPAAELRHYYAIRPKLRKYTLGVELDRMEYTLTLENGSCTCDKDVIRSYFGVDEDGGMVCGDGEEEEVEATVEELLIRSANQSLLADALVALTGSEEDVLVDDTSCEDDDFFNDNGAEEKRSMGLILSGPTLCMSSVAETCQFTVDLQCGKVEALCDLAISVPFHGDVTAIQELLGYDEQLQDKIIGDGRIILARARVSVRFRPGGEGGNENDEPTVQYAIQSINPLLPSNSPVLRQVAIALAHDQEDPFFQEEQRADVGDATDIRDLFLLNQHLLSDSGLLAVSDHLERLRGAAEAKSTGFRSALRQLDGVTNVSGKLQFLKGTANTTRGQGSGSGTSGFLGLGLALPSAEEIEAAEREAQNAVRRQDDATFRFPRPDEVHEGLRFSRPDDVNEGYSRPYDDRNGRPPPPPPPPPPPAPPGRPPQTEEVIARPKPIIGGLFTGLSRLAAAATQPSDLRTEQEWGDEGGTGLTPPSSPKANHFVQAPTTDFPTLYRKEENANIISQSTTGLEDGAIGIVQHPPTHLSRQQPCDQGAEFLSKGEVNGEAIMESTVEDEHEEDGWSDDEFDFEEPVSKDFVEDQNVANEKELKGTPSSTSHAEEEEVVSYLQQDISSVLQFESKTDTQQSIQSKPSRSFSEEISIALQGKIEGENKEMIQSGKLKRWTPLREDRILRQKLMEVMRHNLIQN